MAERTPRGGSGWPTAEDPATGGRPLQGPVAAEKEQAPLVRHVLTLPAGPADRRRRMGVATARGLTDLRRLGSLPDMRRGAWAFCGLAVLLSGCSGDGGATALPPGPAAGGTAASTSPAVRTPAPVDDEAAVPDSDATRTESPAQGSVRLDVRGPVPGGEAGRAYVAWVRASLTAYARPGTDDGGVARYAAAPVLADVR